MFLFQTWCFQECRNQLHPILIKYYAIKSNRVGETYEVSELSLVLHLQMLSKCSQMIKNPISKCKYSSRHKIYTRTYSFQNRTVRLP